MDLLLNNVLVVHQIHASTPLVFESFGTKVNLTDLVDRFCPELSHGAKSKLNPILFNRHLQTAYASLRPFHDVDQVKYRRWVLKYRCGGESTLDFASTKNMQEIEQHQPDSQPYLPSKAYSFIAPGDPSLVSADSKPMLIALHGLAGGSAESYIRSVIHRITTNYGFEACVLNSRGCCHSSITTPQLYNGGWTNDLRECVKELRTMFPNRKFYLLGFSLGASIVTNYLGEEGENSDIEAAVVVGNPWDLSRSSYFINNTIMGQYVYSPVLARNLIKLTQRHLQVLNKNPEFRRTYETKIGSIKTLSEFDDCFTGPLFGYKSGEEYYKDASSFRRIPGIRTPLLALNSLDDPIVGSDSLPEDQIKHNPYILLVETNIGGHVAWVQDNSGNRWYTEPVCRFFSSFHNEISKKGLTPKLNQNILPQEKCPLVKTTILDH